MPRLIMDRDGHTQEYEVTGEVTFGRTAENTIRVPTGKASRRHCRIFEEDGIYYLEDLGSSNGTKCNGKRIDKQMALRNKDKVQVGGLTFTFIETSDDPLVGKRLGKFQIIEPLGKGGMGVVYRAKQVTLGRDVALKVLNPSLVRKKGFVEAFQREAKLAARLQHPNVIGIYDFGQEEEWYFFSMEFVDGEDLFDRMERQGALTAQEAVAFGVQVCDALQHAHEHNILHQDIKPHNLMVDKDNNIKVADLGLANVMQYSRQADKERVSMGTPQYVPPEIIRKRPADARSDLYSLSATLFYLTTGRIPFEATSLKAMLQMHLSDPVPNPRELIPRLPARLAKLIMQGMSKDPARRPDSAKTYGTLLKKSLQKKKSKRAPAAAVVIGVDEEDAAAPVAPKRVAQETQVIEDVSASGRTRRDGKRKSKLGGYIAAGVGIVAVVVLALNILPMITGAEETEASQFLSRTKLLVAQQRYGEAKEELQTLIRSYPDTVAAGAAQAILKQVEAHIEEQGDQILLAFNRIRMDRQSESISVAEAREKLKSMVQDPQIKAPTRALIIAYIKGLAAQEDEATKNDASLQQWARVDGVITRLVEQQRFGDARTLILSYQKKNPDSKGYEKAAERLKGLLSILEEKGATVYAQAQTALAEGKAAEARKRLLQILRDLPGTQWAARAEEDRSRMDNESRSRFFSGWSDILQASKQMNTKDATSAAAMMREDLAHSAWGEPAADMEQLAKALAAFEKAVVLAAGRGEAAKKEDRVSVVGLGLATLSVSDKGALQATGKSGTPRPIGVEKIALLDMLQLLPPQDLTEEQALGAAIYALQQGHKGMYAAYLKTVGKDGTYSSLHQQVRAAAENRAMRKSYNFDLGYEGNAGWRPQVESAEWAFEDGRFGTRVADRALAELTDIHVQLTDAAVAFDVASDDMDGQAGVVLAKDENNFVAVLLHGSKAILQYTKAGAVTRAEAARGEAGGRWKMQLHGGEAILSRDGVEILRLNVSGAENWDTQLRLELNATSGWFDNIVIEEGPGGHG